MEVFNIEGFIVVVDRDGKGAVYAPKEPTYDIVVNFGGPGEPSREEVLQRLREGVYGTP